MVAMILTIVLCLHFNFNFNFNFDAFVIGGLIGLGGLCYGWIVGAGA